MARFALEGFPMFRQSTLPTSFITALGLLAGAASQALAQATITSSPYEAYAPYSAYWYPYYGGTSLYGAAEVIRAQGQLILDQQDGFLKREAVRARRIENRRRELEQFLWERNQLPTAEDNRQQAAEEVLRRARFRSDLTEIWSATALNALLDDARKITSPSADTTALPLSDEVLEKIDVTSGTGSV